MGGREGDEGDLFISPFTVGAKAASHKETGRVIAFVAVAAVRLKQTTRNLCIHLADVGREAANFRGSQMRGEFGRNVECGGQGVRPRARCRQDCDHTRNTQRAGAIARERKVIFHRRSWKTIPHRGNAEGTPARERTREFT